MKVGPVLLLTIVFVILKLTDSVDWSWLWVLSPLWISAAATLATVAIWGSLVALGAGKRTNLPSFMDNKWTK